MMGYNKANDNTENSGSQGATQSCCRTIYDFEIETGHFDSKIGVFGISENETLIIIKKFTCLE